jgi:hypothetical protein
MTDAEIRVETLILTYIYFPNILPTTTCHISSDPPRREAVVLVAYTYIRKVRLLMMICVNYYTVM